MILIVLGKFLYSPEKGFQAIQNDSLRKSLLYLLAMLVLLTVTSSVVQFLVSPAALNSVLVETFFLGLIVNLVLGFWLHIFAYLSGARKGIEQTFKTAWYGSTPYFLLGWLIVIPGIGRYARGLLILWNTALFAIGLKNLHNLSTARAAAAAAAALVLGLVIMISLVIFTFQNFLPFINAIAR